MANAGHDDVDRALAAAGVPAMRYFNFRNLRFVRGPATDPVETFGANADDHELHVIRPPGMDLPDASPVQEPHFGYDPVPPPPVPEAVSEAAAPDAGPAAPEPVAAGPLTPPPAVAIAEPPPAAIPVVPPVMTAPPAVAKAEPPPPPVVAVSVPVVPPPVAEPPPVVSAPPPPPPPPPPLPEAVAPRPTPEPPIVAETIEPPPSAPEPPAVAKAAEPPPAAPVATAGPPPLLPPSPPLPPPAPRPPVREPPTVKVVETEAPVFDLEPAPPVAAPVAAPEPVKAVPAGPATVERETLTRMFTALTDRAEPRPLAATWRIPETAPSTAPNTAPNTAPGNAAAAVDEPAAVPVRKPAPAASSAVPEFRMSDARSIVRAPVPPSRAAVVETKPGAPAVFSLADRLAAKSDAPPPSQSFSRLEQQSRLGQQRGAAPAVAEVPPPRLRSIASRVQRPAPSSAPTSGASEPPAAEAMFRRL